ncbi:MAG: hypothetical protein WC979_02045 [Candidatus Pacearchaeota archaeon]|jgi:hypothetical protein|nr:hypothetical protein [Clostridia bacterium]
MGKGNVQLGNFNYVGVSTYYVNKGVSWEEAENAIMNEKRDAINNLIKQKKCFCCKRTIVECLLPIVIKENEITEFLNDRNEEFIDSFISDVCEILGAKEEHTNAEELSSENFNNCEIICNNSIIAAVIDDNENSIAIAFIPSKIQEYFDGDNKKWEEYSKLAKHSANLAMKKLHSLYLNSMSIRTGSWTSGSLPKETYEDISKYGY